jgi:tRNA (guanine37-N1)-methyltransferase
MRFDIITLFPDLFTPFLTLGVTRRAFDAGLVDVQFWPLRDFADDNYRRVDDRPYGGGPGMVMLAEPLERAITAAQAARVNAGATAGPVIHFSPTGRRIDQALLREMATGPGGLLLCGRYEGMDQRVLDRHVDLELSLGDFVLSGGELPALALLDGLARLQEGVLADARSHQQDSFEDGLLDCPHYSRPEVWCPPGAEPVPVPEVLLSGHHADIARWRRERSLALTAQRRPDLIALARASGQLSKADEHYLSSLGL